MRAGLIAKKIGMSAQFKSNGERIPVTLLKVDHCQILANKKEDKDGYSAVLLASEDCVVSRMTKPMLGIFTKAGISPKKHLKEFRVTEENTLEPGSFVSANHFTLGQYVDVQGTSIGKGMAGPMKRHGFRGLEASHGVSISHRSHGSTGGRQDPGKVFKNKKMAGHMGARNVTIQNLKVVSIDEENQILVIKGSLPGKPGSRVYIRDSVKKY